MNSIKYLVKKHLIFISLIILNFNTITYGQEDSIAIKNTPHHEEIFRVIQNQDIFPDILACEEAFSLKERKDCFTDTLRTSIYKYLIYPKIAKENNVKGTVVLRIEIDKELKTYCIYILKDIGAKAGDAAIRATSLALKEIIPHYKQYKYKRRKPRGNPVKVGLNVPVKFR